MTDFLTGAFMVFYFQHPSLRKYVDLGCIFIMSQVLLFGYFFDVSLRPLVTFLISLYRIRIFKEEP
jgi:hypothetical protein